MTTHSPTRRFAAAAGALALAGAVLLAAPPAGAASAAAVPGGGAPAVVLADGGTIDAASAPSTAVSTGAVNFRIYLPAGFNPADESIRYPTLYLLHGRGDTDSAWTREKADLDSLIEDGSIPPMIVVMPDAPWESGGNWYVDSQYTGAGSAEDVETAITADLVGYIDSHYPTVANRRARAVGGYSMGGYGALRYVLAHQGEFSAGIVLSPAVFTPQPPVPDDIRDYGAFGVGSSLFDADRYTELNYPALLSGFDPTQPVRLFLAVGDKEYAYPNPYEHNDLDFETAVAYNALKRVDGVTADMRVLGGGHNWDVWQPAFVEAMKLIGPVISPNAAQPMDAALFGGTGDDWAGGAVSTTDGGVTMAYATTGDVGTSPNAGDLDIAVTHLDSAGTAAWTTPIANPSAQRSFGMAAGPDGVTYVGGYTGGDLDGKHSGNTKDDAFVSAISTAGKVLWTTQFGDADQADRVYAVGADPAGGVYVGGYTKGSVQKGVANAGDKDAFVAHLDATGSISWVRQFGSVGEDKAFAVTSFDGGVAVAGVAGDAMPGAASAGGSDGFVAAFDADGTRRWIRQVGSADSDLLSGITLGPDGSVVAVGQFAGAVGGTGQGGLDALAIDYSASGEQVWVSRWGTAQDDQAATVTADPAGGYLVIGATKGVFTSSVGGFDIFVSHLAADGSVMSTAPAPVALRRPAEAVRAAAVQAPESGTIQFGTQHDDGVSEYAELNLYSAVSSDRLWITGATFGSTAENRNAGGSDVFLTSLALSASGPGSSTTTATPPTSGGGTTTSTQTSNGGTSTSGQTSGQVSNDPGAKNTSGTDDGTTPSTAHSTAGSTTQTSAAASVATETVSGSSSQAGGVLVFPRGSGGGLSYTGIAVLSLLILAAALIGTGAFAVVTGRRRLGSHLR